MGNRTRVSILASLGSLSLAWATSSLASGQPAHPAYLHALSDLRSARANLQHRDGDALARWDEHRALDTVEGAIRDIKEAAIDDGKNLEDHPPVDAGEPRGGRLLHALEGLRAAREDVSKDDDNAFANGLRARSLRRIEEGIALIEQGMVEAGGRSGEGDLTPDYAWYALDEVQGTTAHDASPHHFDITNLKGVTWDHGANFDGVEGGGYTLVDAAYRRPPLTISIWLTPRLRNDGPGLFAIQPYPQNALSDDIPGVGGYSIGLNIWSNGSALGVQGLADCSAALCAARTTQNTRNAAGTLTCTGAAACNQGFVPGVEHHVVVTLGPVGENGRLAPASVYVDGTLFDETTAGVASPHASPPLFLGCANLDGHYGTRRVFDGRIRDLRIYKHALGVGEIQQLYRTGPVQHAGGRP